MECFGIVGFAEVVQQWARREYIRPDGTVLLPPGIDVSLLLEDDYSDQTRNRLRRSLLANRNPLLDPIPQDTIWFKTKITRNDLSSFRVVRDTGWKILSGASGSVGDAPRNFLHYSQNPLKLPHIQIAKDLSLQQYFDNLVKSLEEFRQSAGNPNNNLTLVLVGLSKDEPFTILEGNHTAVGMYLRHFLDEPHLPYPSHYGYLGLSSSMDKHPFYQH